MRIERWYWLIAFCLVSFLVHVGAMWTSPNYDLGSAKTQEHEVVVTFDSAPTPVPKPAATPKPKPVLVPHETKRAVAAVEKPAIRRAIVRGENRPIAKVTPEHSHKSAAPAAGSVLLPDEKPAPLGMPNAPKTAPQPRTHLALNAPHAGGGTPSPANVFGGKGGAPTPEAPPEEVLYNGGGKGGKNLPKVAPSTGGGGGNSILSVNNPLALTQIPEEKAGLGPGTGGNVGAGNGGGVGFARGKGIGTNQNGKVAVGSLSNASGNGNGNASGSGTGTRPPGGGHGTGAELPGTGGESSAGYGRGKGTGIGNGAASGTEGKGSPSFGDVAGLLNGTGKGAGGSGQGGGAGGGNIARGGVFGAKPRADRDGAVHIVYVLDVSGSMHDGNKIGKAKEVLKQALLGLKPGDTFNIVSFSRDVKRLYPDMLPADPDIVQGAIEYVDRLRLADGTNMSGAMDIALKYEGISQVFLMSDGEPNFGIEDFGQLREYIHTLNKQNVRISTLALCLGEKYKGEPLMRGIAIDTEGTYQYVNLRTNR